MNTQNYNNGENPPQPPNNNNGGPVPPPSPQNPIPPQDPNVQPTQQFQNSQGAQQGQPNQPQQPYGTQPNPYTPQEPKEKSKVPMILGIGCAVILILGLLLTLGSCAFLGWMVKNASESDRDYQDIIEKYAEKEDIPLEDFDLFNDENLYEDGLIVAENNLQAARLAQDDLNRFTSQIDLVYTTAYSALISLDTDGNFDDLITQAEEDLAGIQAINAPEGSELYTNTEQMRTEMQGIITQLRELSAITDNLDDPNVQEQVAEIQNTIIVHEQNIEQLKVDSAAIAASDVAHAEDEVINQGGDPDLLNGVG